MTSSLDLLYTASALGRGNGETLSNLLAHEAPGMKELSGDIPGRAIWFGSVPGELPSADGAGLGLRTNALLKLAVTGYLLGF